MMRTLTPWPVSLSLWQFNIQVHAVLLEELKIPLKRSAVLDSVDEDRSGTDVVVIACLAEGWRTSLRANNP